MTAKKDLKKRVRERQAQTGESYVTARRQVVAQAPPPMDTPPPAKPPVIRVDEMIELSEDAVRLGLRCIVVTMRSMLDRVDGARVLERIRATLDATATDPAMEQFRAVLLRGERVKLPAILRGLWMEHTRRFLDRARAGIGGISDDGDMLAFVVDGVMVLAHIGYWPRPRREHAAPRLSLSVVGATSEGLDSMSVLFARAAP